MSPSRMNMGKICCVFVPEHILADDMVRVRWRSLHTICQMVEEVLFFGIIVNILRMLPRVLTNGLAKIIHTKGQLDPDGTVSPQDLLQSSGNWGTIRFKMKTYLREAFYGFVSLGEKVPNIKLLWVKQNGVESCRLQDFMQQGRPLVLNFGNCS